MLALKVVLVLLAVVAVSAKEEEIAHKIEWGKVQGKMPSGNIWSSCSHCNSDTLCSEWCESTTGCQSVVWTENWKTCDGYDKVHVDLVVTASRPNAVYIFKQLSASPLPFNKFTPNHPPVLAQAINTQEAQVGVPFELEMDGHFSDTDGDRLTYSAKGLPMGLKVKDSLVFGQPRKDGRYKVTLSANDGKAFPTVMPPFWLVVKSEQGVLPPMLSDEEYAVLEAKRAANQKSHVLAKKVASRGKNGGKSKGKGKGKGKGHGKNKLF